MWNLLTKIGIYKLYPNKYKSWIMCICMKNRNTIICWTSPDMLFPKCLAYEAHRAIVLGTLKAIVPGIILVGKLCRHCTKGKGQHKDGCHLLMINGYSGLNSRPFLLPTNHLYCTGCCSQNIPKLHCSCLPSHCHLIPTGCASAMFVALPVPLVWYDYYWNGINYLSFGTELGTHSFPWISWEEGHWS